EVEAIDSGILRIPANSPKPGSSVRVGDLLGYLRSGNEATLKEMDTARRSLTPDPRPLTPAPSPRPRISPRALRTAIEQGVDWSKLTGTGRAGRIRERDVLAAAPGTDRATA